MTQTTKETQENMWKARTPKSGVIHFQKQNKKKIVESREEEWKINPISMQVIIRV